APHTTARADVEIVNSVRLEHCGTPHVVFEVAVAAVDDRVAAFEMFGKGGHRLLSGVTRGNHQPDRAWRRQTLDEIRERGRAGRADGGRGVDRIRAAIPDDDLVTAVHQSSRHVAAHAAEADQSYLHPASFFLMRAMCRPPSNGVVSHTRTIASACASV